MWKKLDDLASVPSKASPSSQEEDSVTQMLMSAIRDSSHEKEQQTDDPEPKVANDQVFQEYAEAVAKFTKSAREFIRCAPLLSEARQAYEKLRSTSEQIRQSLDSDEQQFRILMGLAQDQANVHLAPAEPPLERKPPEPSKPEPFVANSDNRKMNIFP
jgi:hypothetical protein